MDIKHTFNKLYASQGFRLNVYTPRHSEAVMNMQEFEIIVMIVKRTFTTPAAEVRGARHVRADRFISTYEGVLKSLDAVACDKAKPLLKRARLSHDQRVGRGLRNCKHEHECSPHNRHSDDF